MEAVPASCLEELRPLALQACVIGIDEGQFVSLHILYIFFSLSLQRDRDVLLRTHLPLTIVIVVSRHGGVL